MNFLKTHSPKLIHAIFLFAGLALVMAASIRFMIYPGAAQILSLPDPVLGLTTRHVVLGIGALELAVGVACIFARSIGMRATLLAWLMMNWGVYQVGLHYAGYDARCSAIGTLTDPLRISGTVLGQFYQLSPYILIATLCLIAFLLGITRESKLKFNYVKVACPGCGGHIEFRPNMILSKIACPHCGGGVRPQNLPKLA